MAVRQDARTSVCGRDLEKCHSRRFGQPRVNRSREKGKLALRHGWINTKHDSQIGRRWAGGNDVGIGRVMQRAERQRRTRPPKSLYHLRWWVGGIATSDSVNKSTANPDSLASSEVADAPRKRDGSTTAHTGEANGIATNATIMQRAAKTAMQYNALI